MTGGHQWSPVLVAYSLGRASRDESLLRIYVCWRSSNILSNLPDAEVRSLCLALSFQGSPPVINLARKHFDLARPAEALLARVGRGRIPIEHDIER